MTESLIGRRKERQNLSDYLHSGRSEFIAVYGRRRVGKTFLIRQTIGTGICFSITGLENVSMSEQLTNFYLSLRRVYPCAEHCRSWLEAFDQLETFLEEVKSELKILFFDEMPWLDTAKSDFISALEHFWNSWASARTDIKLITCGSAASWMLDHLINNYGGLHNRVTHQMLIEPFTLAECKDYFDTYGYGYAEKEIAECYMVLGGIPYYLSLMDRNSSVAQNIDRLFFSPAGELRNEKENLFRSLFKHSEDYVNIIEALSTKGKGLTRTEIIEITHLDNNSRLTKILHALENCRFIRSYCSYDNRKRMTTFQITDPFLHFCHQIQEKCSYQDESYWSHSINSPAFNTWSGFAFEILCLNHTSQIKNALNIGGVQTNICCWRTPQNIEKGAQIDLLIDRADHCVNLCEMKYSSGEYNMTKSEREKLEHRAESFINYTNTRNSIRITLITNCGVKQNVNSRIVQNQVLLEDLFR